VRYYSKHADAKQIAKVNEIVRGPHQTDVRVMTADFRKGHWFQNYGIDPTEWSEPSFEIISGEVSETMEPVTRELTLSVVSEYWRDPFDSFKDISPYRTLLSVERGVDTPEGIIWVPFGVFRVYEIEARGSGGGGTEISVTAYSLEASIRDARLTEMAIVDQGFLTGARSVREIIEATVRDAFGMSATNMPLDFTAVPREGTTRLHQHLPSGRGVLGAVRPARYLRGCPHP
jgi:hypothetical protein